MISVVCVMCDVCVCDSETGADSGGSSQEAGDEERPRLFQEMLHSSLQPQQELSQGTLQHYNTTLAYTAVLVHLHWF